MSDSENDDAARREIRRQVAIGAEFAFRNALFWLTKRDFVDLPRALGEDVLKEVPKSVPRNRWVLEILPAWRDWLVARLSPEQARSLGSFEWIDRDAKARQLELAQADIAGGLAKDIVYKPVKLKMAEPPVPASEADDEPANDEGANDEAAPLPFHGWHAESVTTTRSSGPGSR